VYSVSAERVSPGGLGIIRSYAGRSATTRPVFEGDYRVDLLSIDQLIALIRAVAYLLDVLLRVIHRR
jgi:hypothetical protein